MLLGLNWWLTTSVQLQLEVSQGSPPSGLRCCWSVSLTSAVRASFCCELYFWSLIVTFRVTWKIFVAVLRAGDFLRVHFSCEVFTTSQIRFVRVYYTLQGSSQTFSSHLMFVWPYSFSTVICRPFRILVSVLFWKCDSPGFAWVSTIRLNFFIAEFAISQMYEAESRALQTPQPHQWLQLTSCWVTILII